MRELFTRGAVVCTGLLASLSPALMAQGFWEDSHGKLTLRNYYFNDGYRDGGEDRKEWAQGFLLNLQSGYTEGTVGFGLDALGLSGIRLDSSRAHAGTGLLPVHDDGRAASEFSSLGVTAKMRIGEAVVKTGTLLPKIPVLVYNDGRLLPQTFQGTQVEYSGVRNLYVHAGHLDKFKLRNSTDSVDIYPQGYSGKKGSDFDFAGATYAFTPKLSGTCTTAKCVNSIASSSLAWCINSQWVPAASPATCVTSSATKRARHAMARSTATCSAGCSPTG